MRAEWKWTGPCLGAPDQPSMCKVTYAPRALCAFVWPLGRKCLYLSSTIVDSLAISRPCFARPPPTIVIYRLPRISSTFHAPEILFRRRSALFGRQLFGPSLNGSPNIPDKQRYHINDEAIEVRRPSTNWHLSQTLNAPDWGYVRRVFCNNGASQSPAYSFASKRVNLCRCQTSNKRCIQTQNSCVVRKSIAAESEKNCLRHPKIRFFFAEQQPTISHSYCPKVTRHPK